jgi:hypothetical protein
VPLSFRWVIQLDRAFLAIPDNKVVKCVVKGASSLGESNSQDMNRMGFFPPNSIALQLFPVHLFLSYTKNCPYSPGSFLNKNRKPHL